MNMTIIIQFLVLTTVVSGVLIFFLKKILFDSTQGAVNRLNRETEEVRSKQTELNEKIKEANEELAKRRSEADALVDKMKTNAEEKAAVEREKMITKARSDAEEIINKAQKTKDEIRRVLEQEMKIKAVDFTTLLLNEILSKKALESFNENFISEFLDDVEKVDMDIVAGDVNSADVTTSIPLSDKLKNRLGDILKKKLDRTIEIKASVDEKIVSGMLLKFGNLKLDGSLTNMLKEKGEEVKIKLDKGIIE